MGTDTSPLTLSDDQLDNIQGDIWSKGFPKYYETYYLFAINPKHFTRCLPDLFQQSPPLISNLRKVKKDQDDIQERRRLAREEAQRSGIPVKDVPLVPVANALIAFTRKGLEAIQAGVAASKISLGLLYLDQTDPAFSKGMASPERRDKLSDPAQEIWDPLFRSDKIHGVLKIAGSSKLDVENHLRKIKESLKHGIAIEDAFPGKSVDGTDSRVDGWTRPNDRGKEHFGFQDNISQPLMKGIDELAEHPSSIMITNPNVIIVTASTNHETGYDRPSWTNNGSFLVFRKLEQDVQRFEALTSQWKTYNCKSKEHMGAKLVGRWQSGAPLAVPEFKAEDVKDPSNYTPSNEFVFSNEICPMSAHIRKTNPRFVTGNNSDAGAERAKMIRNGIPYGPDYKKDETGTLTRGLLFACYQGSIEDAFEHMQSAWCNNINFPSLTTGPDPIIGQIDKEKIDKGKNDKRGPTTKITDENGEVTTEVPFNQLVTLKGGEYFFAPSIAALKAWGSPLG